MKRILPFLLVFAFVVSSCQLPGFGTKNAGCGPAALKIGDRSYQIKNVKAEKDGSLKIPGNQPETAYWVEGTETNQVFALSPTENNLALPSSLKNGDTVSVMWQNCNSTTYTIADIQSTVPDNSALIDQSTSQVTIFVRGDSSGFVAKGDLAGESITTFNTPDASQKLAEISLLETSASKDGKSINISVSINNYGSSAFTLSPTDVSLMTADGTPVTMTSSDLALPKEIVAGKTETFQFTFPRPITPTATLKVLTVEYDVEGY
jgi:hypothetical protein